MKYYVPDELETEADFEEAINYATDQAEELVFQANELSKLAQEWYDKVDKLWEEYFSRFTVQRTHEVSEHQIELNPDFFKKE